MGQYFMAVDKTKKEYFKAWDIGGLAKFWEWCTSYQAGVMPYLLRRSDESGGGDVHYQVPEPRYAGRWAGDEVYLVGDCDSSKLYQEAGKTYTNIAQGLVEEYNRFIEIKQCLLRYKKPSDN